MVFIYVLSRTYKIFYFHRYFSVSSYNLDLIGSEIYF